MKGGSPLRPQGAAEGCIASLRSLGWYSWTGEMQKLELIWLVNMIFCEPLDLKMNAMKEIQSSKIYQQSSIS